MAEDAAVILMRKALSANAKKTEPTVDTPIFAGETFSFPEGDDPKKFRESLGFDPHEHRRRAREERWLTEPYANANFLLVAPNA